MSDEDQISIIADTEEAYQLGKAKTMTQGAVQMYEIAYLEDSSAMTSVEAQGMIEAHAERVTRLQQGDFTDLLGLLSSQLYALNSLMVGQVTRSRMVSDPEVGVAFVKNALTAQSLAVRTAEAIIHIQSPSRGKTVIAAGQVNLANQQVVNNEINLQASTEKTTNEQEVEGSQYGRKLRQNRST